MKISFFLDSLVAKVIVVAWGKAIVPVGRQFKYVFCYKSNIANMKAVDHDLEKKKKIVEESVKEASYNLRVITDEATEWLQEVDEAQQEARSLFSTYEQDQATRKSCIGGQILNPIARHHLGRKATKKKQTIEELLIKKPKPDEISYAPRPPGIIDHEAVSSAPAANQQTDGVFRSSRWEETMEEITTALKDNCTNVVGLYGMGGVGKSTMVNEVYDQFKKQDMFNEVARVEVKVKPDIKRIQGEIAFQLGLKFKKEWSSAVRADMLRERLLKTNINQKKKTILIILDDLWEKLDLQEVGIPLGGNDQVYIKLFLTSRHEYLLSDKMGAHNPIHLDVLGDADALRMFKFFVEVGAEGVKVDKVTEVARKCSGLPIVIEATAKALKNRALGEWEEILKRLDNDDVLEKLKVSYEYLPSKESKELFLICGITWGPRIRVKDLLKYTFGLRLYNRKDSSTLVAATAKLERLLSSLEAASMLLKSNDSRYVKIHDHMRDLAVAIVEEDRPEWAYDVTLSNNSIELDDVSELKLLLSCCKGDAVELRDSFLKDMEKLNVLEFTSLHLRVTLSLPSSTTQLDHLRNLRTLCLHNCCLEDISMIGELKGLQILSFRGSDIRKLPIQLRELIVLKMLDLSDCNKLTRIEPNVLGSLIKLEELNMENSFKDWKIDQDDNAPPSNARLTELKNMFRLSNVRIHIPSTSMLPKDGQLFSSKLTMYQIMFGVARGNHSETIEDSYLYRDISEKYNKFSRVLILTFDSPDILWQDWVQTTLQSAEVLYLSGRLDEKCVSIGDMCIKRFDCLKHLRMRRCPSFRFIVSLYDASSTNLESLFLEKMENLEKLCNGLTRHEEAFSKLKFVEVNFCNNLKHLFDFSLLQSRLSSQLEEISIHGCAEMQYIVVGDGECDNKCDVTLSNLQKLAFKYLHKFSSFFLAGLPSKALFTGTKVAFPRLESLVIHYVEELEDIWHPTDAPLELGKLRLIDVGSCNKLVRVINSNVLMSLQRNIESLIIGRCGSLKEVFDVNDGIISSYCTDDNEYDLVLFSRLKELSLKEMGELEGVHNINHNLMMKMMKGGRSMTIFSNIESLNVSHCPHLRYVLCCSLPTTTGVGRQYENLKEIKIKECKKMEATVVVMLRSLDKETQPTATATTTATRHDHAHRNYIDHAESFSYSSLKYMEISSCPQLRSFCQYLCSKQDSTADHLPFFSQKEIFPYLESLHLGGLSDKLVEIWPREVPPQSSFNMLKDLTIFDCPELSVLFPSTLIPRLENLTIFKVLRCVKMLQIIIGEEKKSKRRYAMHGDEEASMVNTAEMMLTFPSLIIFHLSDLVKLDRFYSSSSECGFQFPSLKNLVIERCNGLKTLFSRGRHTIGFVDGGVDHDLDTDRMVGVLFRYCDRLAIPNLTSMLLLGLGNLTKICKGEKPDQCRLFLKLESLTLIRCSSSLTNLQSLLSVGVASPSLCYTVLTRLTVDVCDGLEYLLSPVGATSLVHLTHLCISYCNNMKEVVVATSSEENHGADDHIHEITFRYLKYLRLDCLPRLEKFSSVNNMVLNFPALDYFHIEFCPNMTTFSSGTMKTTSTHKFGDLNSYVQELYTDRRR